MWQMIAEPGLRCAECRHPIQPGRLCLSELPEETPAGVSRGDFRNYCIGCPQCWAQGKHACYVRYLDSGQSSGKTPRSLPCARCGRRIGAGEKAGVDVYYDWPEATADGSAAGRLTTTAGAATAAISVDTLIRGVPSGSFSNLSDSLQGKFAAAGLGGERGKGDAPDQQDGCPPGVKSVEGAQRPPPLCVLSSLMCVCREMAIPDE